MCTSADPEEAWALGSLWCYWNNALSGHRLVITEAKRYSHRGNSPSSIATHGVGRVYTACCILQHLHWGYELINR